MERLLIVVVVGIVAVVVATLVQRRRPPVEPADTGAQRKSVQACVIAPRSVSGGR